MKRAMLFVLRAWNEFIVSLGVLIVFAGLLFVAPTIFLEERLTQKDAEK